MPDSNNPILDSIVSIANSGIKPKLLTATNFEVLSVEPFKESTSGHNTLVTVKIDLGAASPLIAMTEADRYAKRSVKLTRIDLLDVVKFREIETNELGQYLIEAETIADVIEALDFAANPNELEEIVVDEENGISIIRAVPNSLGYKGQFTISKAGPGLPNVAGLNITNVNLPTQGGDGEVQLTYTTVPNPANTGGIAVWTVTAGGEFATVSNTGLLTIVDAPNGTLIGVRLTSLNGVTVTKNIPTHDVAQ